MGQPHERHERCEEEVRQRGQAGIALVPSIIAVAIVSLTVLALFSALLAIMASTNAHRRTTRASIEVTSIAEGVRRLSYVNCETAGAMQTRLTTGSPAVYTAPSGYSLSVTGVTYLDDANTSTPGFQTSCVPANDRGVQRVVVRVTSAGAPSLSEEIVVHKRRDTCPSSFGAAPGEKC